MSYMKEEQQERLLPLTEDFPRLTAAEVEERVLKIEKEHTKKGDKEFLLGQLFIYVDNLPDFFPLFIEYGYFSMDMLRLEAWQCDYYMEEPEGYEPFYAFMSLVLEKVNEGLIYLSMKELNRLEEELEPYMECWDEEAQEQINEALENMKTMANQSTVLKRKKG